MLTSQQSLLCVRGQISCCWWIQIFSDVRLQILNDRTIRGKYTFRETYSGPAIKFTIMEYLMKIWLQLGTSKTGAIEIGQKKAQRRVRMWREESSWEQREPRPFTSSPRLSFCLYFLSVLLVWFALSPSLYNKDTTPHWQPLSAHASSLSQVYAKK